MMKRIKVLVASAAFVFAVGSPALLGASASAAEVNRIDGQDVSLGNNPIVECPTSSGSDEFPTVDENFDSCDLAVDKQVSVNGGAYEEADTSADAANAHVGDTISWKITVTNNSGDLVPLGFVYVKDVLPSGVTFDNFTASAGTYEGDDGMFFANTWQLPLRDGSNQTTLPATLVINTTATTVGSIENTATLFKYDNGHCDGGCVYGDADPSNDSNDAWINVQTPPQVLGASTGDPQVLGLTNTGTGTLASVLALVLFGSTIAVAGYGKLYKRRKTYKLL